MYDENQVLGDRSADKNRSARIDDIRAEAPGGFNTREGTEVSDGRRDVTSSHSTPATLTDRAQPSLETVVQPPTQDLKPALEKTPDFEEAPSAPSESQASVGTQPPAPPADASAPKGTSRRKLIFSLLGAIAAIGAAVYGHYWWTTGRFIVSTDDAYVGADTTTIAAKVAGYVTAVDVTDNEQISKGQVIAQIDPGDYQLALRTARDNVATQTATIARIAKQIVAQEASVDQAKSQVASAKAAETRTSLDLTRQKALAKNHFASAQTLQKAQSDYAQAVAAVQGAQAGVEVAQTNIGVLQAQKKEAENTLKQLQTAVATAKRNLSFTTIHAPIDGMIGNRAIRVGDYVQPAQRLASLVPLAHVYINANFKETEVAGIKRGQKAQISVDALPGRSITGTVLSMAPASGSVFSLLPPDNATGNFTKIVQRIPVRIAVPADVARQELLRPGMSVVIHINTKQPGTPLPHALLPEDTSQAPAVAATGTGEADKPQP